MPSKNPVEPRRECLCEPGSSPKELPRRNRYFSPSRFRLGLGTKCTVWSCLLFCACVIVISGLLGLCQLSCFGNKNLAASRLLRSATWCASNFGWTLLGFLSSIDFQQKKSVYGQCLSSKKGNEKKRKLKQPLNNLNFGLPLCGLTSRSWRLLLRQLKGLFTELMGLLMALHWSHFSRSKRPFQTLFSAAHETSHFSTASQKLELLGLLIWPGRQKNFITWQSFFKSHFCSTI